MTDRRRPNATMPIRRLAFVCGLVFACLAPVRAADAQILGGAWVEPTEQAVREHRTTDLRVIVLDADGAPTEGAQVRLQQVEHDFALGVAWYDGAAADRDAGLPVVSQLNAVDLSPLTAWATLQPEAEQREHPTSVERAIRQAAVFRHVRWGALVSADPAGNPDWLARSTAETMWLATQSHIDDVLRRYGRRLTSVDLYADAGREGVLEQRLGFGAVRSLFQHAKFTAPRVAAHLAVDAGLDSGQTRRLADRVGGLVHGLVAIDGLTIRQRFDGVVHHAPVDRAVRAAGRLGLPIVVADLEVGGASPVAAAVNLEIVLRTLFAEPAITGVCFRGLRADDFANPHAALLDEDGQPTPSGVLVEGLFGRHWRTDLTASADEVGNVDERVFAGRYRLTVAIPDGPTFVVHAHVPKSEQTKVLVVQPPVRSSPNNARELAGADVNTASP